MHQDPPPQPFDLRDLRLDIKVKADRYEASFTVPKAPNPEFLEPEELPF